VRCLSSGVGQMLSSWVRNAGRPELVVLGRPAAARAKKSAFNCPPRGGRGYTTNRRKPKKEIPGQY
jgi:hypothetical protein